MANKNELKPVKIALDVIKVDHELQPRVEMDMDHCQRMSRSYEEGGEEAPPAVHLFLVGLIYYLVDGFHRFQALWSLRHNGAKYQHIRAYVHEGTMEEAIEFAVKANLDNRSKPLSDLDRKKAMWLMMDLPEWREKSSAQLAKLVGIAKSTGQKYWLEYFPAHGIPTPSLVLTADGRLRRPKRDKTKRVLTRDSRGRYNASVNGEAIYFGRDLEKAEEKLAETLNGIEVKKLNYEDSELISRTLKAGGFLSRPTYGLGNKHPRRGRHGGGIAVTWESFKEADGVMLAYGRACHARLKSGSHKAVVLCPVEQGPQELIEDFREMGVEWMTVEEFLVSLGGKAGPAEGEDVA